jgi:hypothetical protein
MEKGNATHFKNKSLDEIDININEALEDETDEENEPDLQNGQENVVVHAVENIQSNCFVHYTKVVGDNFNDNQNNKQEHQ